MKKPTIPQNLKGFRDLLPQDKRQRDYILNKARAVAETFGFEPLETPTLEYASLLLGKYGEEADKLVYSFVDRGKREVALRYDQTVPTARILAQYRAQLPKYFRRYQIQNVFRADKPQKGRFREFTQFDIDIFNSQSPLADAEIIACTYFIFKSINYPGLKLKLNDREILFSVLKPFVNSQASVFSLIQTFDKLEKIGPDGVTAELIKKGVSLEAVKMILAQFAKVKPSENLTTIIDYVRAMGVPAEAIEFVPTLARGLDYYTGMIFEIAVPQYLAGSLGGGGRYDNLIEQLSGIRTPAVGIAYGVDRMIEAAKQFNLFKAQTFGTRVMVTVFSSQTLKQSLEAAEFLRNNNISTELYPEMDKLDKQLKYADSKQIPFCLIIGEEEAKAGKVTLKNMKQRTQQTVILAQLNKLLKS